MHINAIRLTEPAMYRQHWRNQGDYLRFVSNHPFHENPACFRAPLKNYLPNNGERQLRSEACKIPKEYERIKQRA